MIANRLVLVAATMLVAPLALAQAGGGGSSGGGSAGGGSGSAGGAGASASPGGIQPPGPRSAPGASTQRSVPNLLDDQMGLPRNMETLRSGSSRVPTIMDDQTGMPRSLDPRRDTTPGSSATGAGQGAPGGSGSSTAAGDDPLDGQSRIPPEDRFRFPTSEDCSRGWSSGLRWTEGEFEALCKR